MKEYLIRSFVSALVFIGLTVVFDAIFNEVGSIWKYLISGVLFGFAYEGWWYFYRKRTFSKDKMSIRAAQTNDLPDIMAVLEAAKGIMRASGNTKQWADGYPSEEDILQDINRGYGQVVVADGRIAGYFAFIPSPEPTYATIYDGAWLDDSQPYHVVHRIGSYPEIHGVFRAIMDWCFTRDANIRIDTHRDNRIMQHNIEKYGFRYCGIIYLASGDERLAYQKMNT